MGNSLVSAVFLGGAAVYADSYITMGILGFENPYILFALVVIWMLALLGLFAPGEKGRVVSALIGIPLGAVATNALRVNLFGNDSLLKPLGL
jgi:predicted membrane channel-forming protein YqfA (hemolysin III family)